MEIKGRMRTSAVVACVLALVARQSRPAEAALCYRSFTQAAYPNCTLLSPSYALHWSISGTTISYGVEVDGSVGWLGLGISDGGGMSGADITVVQTTDNGATWTIGDYFVEQEVRPSLDSTLGGTQDVTLLSSVVRTAAYTAAAFRRPLESCDPWDWPIMQDVDQTLIWAYGSGALAYHGASNRGSATVRLQPLVGAPPQLPDPSDLQPLLLQLPTTFAIPTDVTTYMCTNLALPMDAKYQIIRYDSVILNDLVHHQVLYSCTSPPSHPVGEIYECLSMEEANCGAFYMISAPGVGTINMPPQAALPFGLGSVQYLVLQIHYNNPLGLAGQVDQSGFKAYVTRQLRPQDMGVLTLGSTQLSLPPGQSSFIATPNACPGTCTRKLAAPLNIFSSFLHMHHLGKSISTRLIRDGQELPAIGFKNYYNYDAQGVSNAPLTSRTIQAGDNLITTCTYDTTGVANKTTFGPASSDEMCFNFLMFWPALPDLDICITMETGDSYPTPVATCTAVSKLQVDDMDLADFVAAGLMVVSPEGGPVYQPYVSSCGLTATRTRAAASSPPVSVAPPAGGLPPPPTSATPPASAPDTKGAIAAIVVVTVTCALVGWALWYRFGRPQDLRDALLEAELARMLMPQA